MLTIHCKTISFGLWSRTEKTKGEPNKQKSSNNQSTKTEPAYNYVKSSLSLYDNHFPHLLTNRSSFAFNLYVRGSITSISSIIDIHCLLLGVSVWSQFFVMAFFPATKRVLTRCWSTTCTDPSKCPRYRTRQDLGITYPNTLQRTEWTFPQKGCTFMHFQKMCVIWIHVVTQSPTWLVSTYLFTFDSRCDKISN